MANLLSASSMAIFFEKTPLNGANLLKRAWFLLSLSLSLSLSL
jgi:hypothetical protein